MSFGPPEYFALAIFGLSVIASVSGDSILKGIISGCLGILIAEVGMDAISGMARFTFGNVNLYKGINMLAVLLGVYAIAQMISRINGTEQGQASRLQKLDKTDKLTFREFKHPLLLLQRRQRLHGHLQQDLQPVRGDRL